MSRDQAKELLSHYLQLADEACGVSSHDAGTDAAAIVDCVVDAAVEEAIDRARRHLLGDMGAQLTQAAQEADARRKPTALSPSEADGLCQKYRVERCDGEPLKGGFAIVLEMGDPRGWPALERYASTVESQGQGLFADALRRALREARGE